MEAEFSEGEKIIFPDEKNYYLAAFWENSPCQSHFFSGAGVFSAKPSGSGVRTNTSGSPKRTGRIVRPVVGTESGEIDGSSLEKIV